MASIAETEKSIHIIEQARQTHVNWLKYREEGFNDHPYCGMAEHHQKYVEDYDLVLIVLRGLLEKLKERKSYHA